VAPESREAVVPLGTWYDEPPAADLFSWFYGTRNWTRPTLLLLYEWYNDTECDHFNPCLLVCSIPHAWEGVWQGAHRHEGATTATMLELVFCVYQLPRNNARCICDDTQLRYETSLCSEDDSTSPTKWRTQGHKDLQSHLIFFKSN